MSKSKWFRVAVEGATATDGRTIEKTWLTDIAATYNPQTYGARVNLEHIRGIAPTSPFKAYGDVLAVKTEEVTLSIGGKSQKKLALLAQVDPTDELVAFTKDRQKIYTSIEVAPDFAKTGKAGLVGLAVTDSPASLGTDVLSFSATPDNAAATALRESFDSRKQDKANLFSAAEETVIEYEAVVEDKTTSFLASIADNLAKLVSGAGAKAEPEKKAEPETPPTDLAAFAKGIETAITTLATNLDAQREKDQAAMASLKAEVASLTTKLDTVEQPKDRRPHNTGGAGHILTDC